jgi:hypothetical protein
VRYNAKARGSIAGSSGKRGKPKKTLSTEAEGNSTAGHVVRDTGDSNAMMIIPPDEGNKKSASSDEARARMKAEVSTVVKSISPLLY